MNPLYLLLVIGLCGCSKSDITYDQGNDRLSAAWDSAYSNVTLTAVRDGKVIQIGSPSVSAFSVGEIQQLKSFVSLIESSTNSKSSVRVGAAVTNIIIGSDFVGTFQLGAKFYPLQTLP